MFSWLFFSKKEQRCGVTRVVLAILGDACLHNREARGLVLQSSVQPNTTLSRCPLPPLRYERTRGTKPITLRRLSPAFDA